MFKKVKDYLINDSKSYRVTRTHLERPRLLLVGTLYIIGVFAILFIGIEWLDFGEVIFAPLSVLEPVTQFFINVDTGEPRNILGWVYLGIIFLGIIISFVGLCLPGLYMAIKASKLLDKEWPDDPKKTKEWRKKHADK